MPRHATAVCAAEASCEKLYECPGSLEKEMRFYITDIYIIQIQLWVGVLPYLWNLTRVYNLYNNLIYTIDLYNIKKNEFDYDISKRKEYRTIGSAIIDGLVETSLSKCSRWRKDKRSIEIRVKQ